MSKSGSTRREFGPNWTVGQALEEVVSFSAGTDRGFTFIQPDRTEKFYSFEDICNEADRRARDVLERRPGALGDGERRPPAPRKRRRARRASRRDGARRLRRRVRHGRRRRCTAKARLE